MPLRSSTDHYRIQQSIGAATARRVQRLAGQADDDFGVWWARIRQPIREAVQQGRAAAAGSSLGYVPAVLEETGQRAAAASAVDLAGVLRTAPDGRDVGSLLDRAPIEARMAVARGATTQQALSAATAWLVATTLTVVADTSRDVVSVDIAQRPTLTGYVRMLNPPSCSRCVILAGKWFRWNEGFLRHPRCDCRHVPASENIAGDLTTDPYEYFKSLTNDEQDQLLGRSNARAVRDGGDIFRVVNIEQRGLGTARGARLYGTPTRMTPDDIYRVAGTRSNAIRMLQENGYITGAQNPQGNILGAREGFGALGRGGARQAASASVTTARTTGVRDPLNRYTMTSAERRLYDAHYRLEVARTGVYPRSVGMNSADSVVAPRQITPAELAGIEQAFSNELARAATGPQSVRNLARLLGVL